MKLKLNLLRKVLDLNIVGNKIWLKIKKNFVLFVDVVPYSAHIPSYADIWGWVMVNITDN